MTGQSLIAFTERYAIKHTRNFSAAFNEIGRTGMDILKETVD
jgi:hypothetical protein